jgi:hypothetical protein
MIGFLHNTGAEVWSIPSPNGWSGSQCFQHFDTGLPDGIFSNQTSQFGYIMEGRGMGKVGVLYDCLEYITAVWYMLCPFGNLVTIWYIFPRFGILCQEKSGNPVLTELTRMGNK